MLFLILHLKIFLGFLLWPVNTLTEFLISGTEITEASATTYDSSSGYYLYKDRGRLTYSLGFDYGYQKNVKAKYNAGYLVTHSQYSELQFYTYLLVKSLYERIQEAESANDVISETMGNYRYVKASSKDLASFFGIPDVAFHAIFRDFRRETLA